MKTLKRQYSVIKMMPSTDTIQRFSLQDLGYTSDLRLRPATLLKKKLWHRYFPVNFTKFLRTPFLSEHLRWLSLSVCINCYTKPVQAVR